MNEFKLQSLGELFAEPPEPTNFIIDNLLVAGTVSCVVAKPKVGKGTFARNAALCIAQGRPFLGRQVQQGVVIYLALEDRKQEVRDEFAKMGATCDEPVLIHADSAPRRGLAAVVALVKQWTPTLVVIDPLIRAAHIRSEKEYAEMYNALGPLIDVAKETGTHILIVHHCGKSIRVDAIDAPLGSTAIGAAVSTLIVLKRTGSGLRSIQTVQRVAADMPETMLCFDPQTHKLSLGDSRFESDCEESRATILAFLCNSSEPQTQAQIRAGVEGRTAPIRAALTALVSSGEISRSGTGQKGDAYKYWFRGSQHIQGTSKPESPKVPPSRINKGEKVVPAISSKRQAREPESAAYKPDGKMRGASLLPEDAAELDYFGRPLSLLQEQMLDEIPPAPPLVNRGWETPRHSQVWPKPPAAKLTVN